MQVKIADLGLTELRVSAEGKLILVGPDGPTQTEWTWAEITELFCHQNQLTSLPSLPEGLKQMDCGHNRLTSLPSLPKGLKWLCCSDNLLRTLPPLLKYLKVLDCSGNLLRTLPPLSEDLKWLYCNRNLLRTLPPLSEDLKGVYCGHNLLQTLPLLPGCLKVLYCSGNPFDQGVDVECVPETLRPIIPREVYDLYVTLTTQRKEQFRKMLSAVTGRPTPNRV